MQFFKVDKVPAVVQENRRKPWKSRVRFQIPGRLNETPSSWLFYTSHTRHDTVLQSSRSGLLFTTRTLLFYWYEYTVLLIGTRYVPVLLWDFFPFCSSLHGVFLRFYCTIPKLYQVKVVGRIDSVHRSQECPRAMYCVTRSLCSFASSASPVATAAVLTLLAFATFNSSTLYILCTAQHIYKQYR